jgi:hypothetical protein
MTDIFVDDIPETSDNSLLTVKKRQARDLTLNQTVDRVNPVWYASLTDSQRAELASYRQALLDVTQQQGFPDSINWPEKPSWL